MRRAHSCKEFPDEFVFIVRVTLSCIQAHTTK